MKWVTRERAMVDRIACPWLIRRFIDPEAEFLYVPKERVLDVAAATGAIPFDVPGVELGHRRDGEQELVTFDAVLRKYAIRDAALDALAAIVRQADGGTSDAAEGPGLRAAAAGFRAIARDDADNQRLQFPLYDALYAFCRERLRAGREPTSRAPA
jgi:hypothetical protein